MDVSKQSPVRVIKTQYEGSQLKLIITSSFALISALDFGIAIGYSSPAIPSMIRRGVIRQEDLGWFGSMLTLGAMIGGLLGGWFVEKIGRKRSLVFISLPFSLGFFLLAMSTGSMQCFLGRFLTGIGSGMVTICVPIYIAEISTPSMRGILGSCVQLMITIGIALSYTLGLNFEWRLLASIATIPCVISGLASMLVPETPRWLISQNRRSDAFKAFAAVRDPHSDITEEVRNIEQTADGEEQVSFQEVIRKRELFYPVFLAVCIMIFQQLSGINVVMFYSETIFQEAVGDFSRVATVIVGYVQIFATMGGVYFMDRAGRRKLLSIGGIIMAVTLFCFGLFYKLKDNAMNESLKMWIPVLCLTLFIVGFSIGWGPIPMLIMSEIIPSSCKGIAGSCAIVASWGSAFLVTNGFSSLQTMLGNDGVFYLFGLCCIAAVSFVLKLVPETKGKSLEEIMQYFGNKKIGDVNV